MIHHRRILIAAIALAIAVSFAGYVMVLRPGHMIGASASVNKVELAQVLAFAERANSAYHEEGDFRHEYGPDIEHGEFPGSGLRVYVDRNPANKAQWVIIRGTANMQDVFDDLEFIGSDDHELGINVHAGFDRSLQECLPWILERLDPSRPIWVTGHSLGGAVAVLLVATLDHRGYHDASAITFGQPKFTDAQGANKLAHLKILRIVHDEDPIPMLPPVDVEGKSLAIYHHCGPEVIIRADGHFRVLPQHSADRMNVMQFWTDIAHLRPMYHDMVKGYLPALKSALASTMRSPTPNNRKTSSAKRS